jgi:hypothetical protein
MCVVSGSHRLDARKLSAAVGQTVRIFAVFVLGHLQRAMQPVRERWLRDLFYNKKKGEKGRLKEMSCWGVWK